MNAAEHMADIANYCRVDADDTQLAGFVAAAEDYLTDAGVSSPEEGSARAARYLQCVKYLTLDLYDRRDTAVDGAANENPAFRRMLNQLKLSERVPESDT